MAADLILLNRTRTAEQRAKALPNGASVCLAVLFGLVSSAVSPDLAAGDWTTEAGLTVSTVRSSNICLDEEEEVEEWVNKLTPRASIRGEGGRAQLRLSVSAELNDLDDELQQQCSQNRSGAGAFSNSVDNFNPRMSAEGKLELIENLAFIDVSARVQQNRVNPFLTAGDDNLNFTANQNTTYHYGFDPYLTWRVKDIAKAELKFGFDQQRNSDRSVEDSDRHSGSLSVGGRLAGPISWGIIGRYAKTEYDERDENVVATGSRDDTEMSSRSFSLGYRFSSQLHSTFIWGEDDNDFQSVNNIIDGEFWRLQFDWTPNSRTTVQLAYGDRFYGDDHSLNISYRHKRSQFSLRYNKDLTLSRSLRVDQTLLDQIDSQGNAIDPVTGQPVSLANNLTTDTRNPIVDERATLAYRLNGIRTSINVEASHSVQTREEDNEESTFIAYSISAERRVSKHFTLNAGYYISDRDAAESGSRLGEDNDTTRANVGVSYQLGSRTSVSVNYSESERQSANAKDTYEEDRLTLSVNMDLK
ncbi:TIGR03016 family PEP-CTERM system-associated outer membrane protein [Pseudomaricurvus alkylphenolicus]|uniref:TIGR03016 family PEP-CTERM system-associated outer membrane protein n=1 Tax=Pseudomaricurvus alkylphenolicus TaxID=1306991 RepID=UPI001422B965|nr:TIGR03016 family PEP-CTERM system-associated outer membrane protein [Pseudomaricurvus alkylphenolicus]NIB43138.1 TIGR03016 family PEP-CTERM system-associated outer membrane protein [Pseudomaricurvus alkylphenolicus]